MASVGAGVSGRWVKKRYTRSLSLCPGRKQNATSNQTRKCSLTTRQSRCSCCLRHWCPFRRNSGDVPKCSVPLWNCNRECPWESSSMLASFWKPFCAHLEKLHSYFIIDQTRLYRDPARDEKNLKRFPWLIQVRPTKPVFISGLEAW